MRRKLSGAFRFLALLLTGTLIAGAFLAQTICAAALSEAAAPDESLYSYRENKDGTVTITEYTGDEEDISVPAELGGHPVSAIGEQAFTNKKMRSLSVPEGILTIETRAFEYCKISGSLSLPAGVSVQYTAFGYAELPEAVTIPAGAILEDYSFGYCKNMKYLNIEPDVRVGSYAFGYSKDLAAVICAAGVTLGDAAFEDSAPLGQVYLCGETTLEGDPFRDCAFAEIVEAEGEDPVQILADLQAAAKDAPARYAVRDMMLTVPSSLETLSQPGYDLFLVDEEAAWLLGVSAFPPSVLDFEKDEAIDKMVETARDYVSVDSAYRVKICGYTAVWINIHNEEDHSIGVYLYISTENRLYHLMFLNMEDSIAEFTDIIQTIVIGEQKDGTDLSALGE